MNIYSVAFCIVLIGNFQVYSTLARRLCDIRIWYLNLVANDVFQSAVTKEQLELKDSIESLVLKTSDKPESRLTDCHVLEMYNGMLRETFSFDKSVGKHMRDYEVKEGDDQDIDGIREQEHAGDMPSEGNSDTTDSSIVPENKESERDDHVSNDITEAETDDIERDTTVDNDDTTENSVENTEMEDDIDETEIFDDEEDTDLSEDDTNTQELDIDNIDILYNQIVFSANTTDRNVPRKKPIPFGICWSFGCFRSEIFDPLASHSMHKMPHAESKWEIGTQYKLESSVCHSKTVCNAICHLYFSKSHCMLDYENNSLSCTEKIDSNREDKHKHENREYMTKSSVVVEENKMNYKLQHDNSEGEGLHDDNTRTVDDNFVTDYENDGNKINNPSSTKRSILIKEMSQSITELDIDDEERKYEMRPLEENDNDKEETMNSLQDKDSDYAPKKMEPPANLEEDHSKYIKQKQNELSLDDFEKLIQQKTGDYSHKIQTLELMIVNLEKQLLLEQLNKQNHSSTYTRLENLVLKLENDLLRMNKYYQNLKDETQAMHKKQNHYLELAYKQEKEKKYLELPDRSTEKFELITKQQSKIAELTDILKNQSNFIHHLKHRQESLEEQNRMLHQMVMNQTIFMTSIIQTVQDVSEQNSKNKQDMFELKQKLEKALDSNKQLETYIEKSKQTSMLETIESLASDKPVKNQHVEEPSLQKTESYGKMEDFSMRWCQAKNDTCPICFYHSVMFPNCVPYSKLFWFNCKDSCKTQKQLLPASPDTENKIKIDIQIQDQFAHNSDAVQKEKYNPINIDMATVDIKNEEEESSLQSSQSNTGTENVTLQDKSEVKQLQDNLEETAEESVETVAIKDYNNDRLPLPNRHIQRDLNEDNSIIAKNKNIHNEDDNSQKYTTGENKDSAQHENGKETFDNDNSNDMKLQSDIKTEKQIILSPSDPNSFPNDKQISTGNKQEPAESPSIPQNSKSPESEEKSSSATDKETAEHKQPDSDRADSGNERPQGNYISAKDEDKSKEDNSKQMDKPDSSIKQEVSTDQQPNDKAPHAAKSDSASNKVNDVKAKNMDKNSSAPSKTLSSPPPNENNTKTNTSKSEKSTTIETKKVEPINIGKEKQKEPKDCYEIYSRGSKGDGIYKIRPLGSNRVMEVFCEMKKGGWTVIQRRQDGSTDFFRSWDEYKKGFGGLYREHWIGNEALHLLTNQDYYKLRVDLIDWDKNKRYAEFGFFLVESEDEGYRLHVEEYSGDAGDGLTKHTGSKFSTKDVDNDKVVKEFGGSCANRFHGAGWYYKCYASNLNGKYYRDGKIPEKMFDGITWKPWTGPNYSLKKVVMKIRPASADDRT